MQSSFRVWQRICHLLSVSVLLIISLAFKNQPLKKHLILSG